MDELQSILEAADSGDFTALTDEQLGEAVDSIRSYGQSIRKDKPTDEDIEDAKTLAAALRKVEVELASRTEAAATRAAEAEEAFAAFGDVAVEVTEDEVVEEPVPVTASRPSAAEVAKRRPVSAEPKPEAPQLALVASALDKADAFGARFEDVDALATVLHSTWDRMAPGTPAQTVARIPADHQYKLGQDGVRNASILNDVAKKAQTAANAGIPITAALGCAPSEPVYDFFNQSARGAGLVDLPMVNARRGSLTYPPAIGFTSIDGQTGIGSQFTGASKTCYTVNCGTTRVTDVIANWTCLTFDNEEGLFYPELVAQYSALAQIAHEHEVNQRLIENMRDHAITTEIHDLDTLGGTVVGLIRAIARVRAYYIERHKMSEGSVVDVLMPYWFAAAYASDIAARQSTDFASAVNLSLARIAADLRQVGANAQFVYDWQQGPAEGYDDFGSFLLYAPGTYVRLDGPVLDLGVVRDSTLNAANDFQIFFESWTGLAAPGIESIYVQGVEICPNGMTGQTGALTCGAS